MIAGCDGLGGGKTQIRFWNGFTGPDGQTMLRLVRQFNQENSDVNVTMQRMAWGTYYNKLFVANLGRRSPEVFIVHTDTLNRFIRAGFLRSYNDLIADTPDFDADDFDRIPWNAAQHEGGQYGIPLDVHMMGMYYNKALLKEYGIVDAEGNPCPPQTKEEFIGALEKLKQDFDNDGKVDQWGAVFTTYRSILFSVMRQYGGRFLSDDGETCVINSPENLAGLEFMVDLIREKGLAPPPEKFDYFDSWISFRRGNAVMTFDGVYMLADLQKEKGGQFGGAPIPQIGPNPAAYANSHNLCISSSINPKKLDAAWRFVQFLSEHSLDWAEGGQVPARASFRQTERFHQMEIQCQFSRELPYIFYSPNVPFVFELIGEFDIAVEQALRGNCSPQEALDTATRKVEEAMARNREQQE